MQIPLPEYNTEQNEHNSHLANGYALVNLTAAEPRIQMWLAFPKLEHFWLMESRLIQECSQLISPSSLQTKNSRPESNQAL